MEEHLEGPLDSVYARQKLMLRSALGPDLRRLLEDPEVTEVYVNTDYIVRVDSFSGRHKTEVIVTPERVKNICNIVAGINEQIINEDHPKLGVEIHGLNVRAQLLYPPIVTRPTFFFRKKPARVFSMEEYLENGSISRHYYDAIVNAIRTHRNLIVVGATGSGKTTFLNAILKKLSEESPDDRLAVLEDVPELQCSSDDVQYMTISGNRATSVTMQDLVFVCLRISPNRIIIGEVRDAAAYDVLKAWNTGHPGGFCTLHANGCADALTRLESLTLEGMNGAEEYIKQLIGSVVDYVVSIQRVVADGRSVRRVDEMIEVKGYDPVKKVYMTAPV